MITKFTVKFINRGRLSKIPFLCLGFVMLWMGLLIQRKDITAQAWAYAFSAPSATITVDGTTCTLAEALDSANNDDADGNGCVDGDGADTIVLQTDVTLSALLPSVTSEITLEGSDHTVDGDDTYQVLIVESNGDLTLNNITITGGNSSDEGGGLFNAGGTVTITNSTFSDNSANLNGGGLSNDDGEVTITNSTFSGNSTFFNGGGVYATSSGTIQISNSTFSDNSSFFNGGGLYNAVNSEILITNSTFSGNIALSGGGLQNAGILSLANSILANSTSGGDCVNNGGSLTDDGGNLVEDNSCGFPVGGDPLLGALADNGGPTLTHALLPGSPALDIALLPNCPSTDQRGVTRPQGTGCDIGAFELEVATPTPTITSTPTATTSATITPSATGTVPTHTPSPTNSPTATPSATCTAPCDTPTASPTPTLTPTPTWTPIPPGPDSIFLPIAIYPIPCFPGPNEQEPNNSTAEANGALCFNQDYFGTPGDNNWDYFSFTLNSPGTITIEVTNHPLSGLGGAQVQLYYESVSTGSKVGEDVTDPYQITYDGAAGTYYILLFNDISKCDQVDCSLSYTLRITD